MKQIDNEVKEQIFRIVDGANFKRGSTSDEATNQILSLIQRLLDRQKLEMQISRIEAVEQAKQEVAREIIALADKRFEVRDRYASYKAEWIELHKSTEEWRELKSRYLGGGE